MTSELKNPESERTSDDETEQTPLHADTNTQNQVEFSKDQLQTETKIDASATKLEPSTVADRRKFFYVLRMCFTFICLLDGVHWAYMLRDDNEKSPNVWKFYGRIGRHEHYYLVTRIFLDAIVGFLGMGAAFWTKKAAFAVPCAFVQPLLIGARIYAWCFQNHLPKDYRTEDVAYVVLEFVLPLLWFILSVATTATLSQGRNKGYQQHQQPPLIVVSSLRTDNEESFQFEISP